MKIHTLKQLSMLSELALALYFPCQDFVANFPRTTTVLFDRLSAVNAMRLLIFTSDACRLTRCSGANIQRSMLRL